MQPLRSLRPNALPVQVADSQHQLQTIHLPKILGLQHRHQHQQQAVVGEAQQPTNLRFKSTYPSIPSFKKLGPEKEHHNGSKK
jgi:hypothetical protein